VAAGTRSLRENAREIMLGRSVRSDAADRALELLELAHLHAALPDQIGQSVRKLVGVARALAAEPRVLLLDEPAAGLDSRASRELGTRLRALVDQGSSMLLIEHDMGLVLSVCDIVTVLDFGRVIASGPPEAVRADPAVVEAYLGKAGKRELGLVESAHE
jgi:branched-chain amino acid transport system ATP-binding protein